MPSTSNLPCYWLDVTEGRQLGLSGSVIYSLAPSSPLCPRPIRGTRMGLYGHRDVDLGLGGVPAQNRATGNRVF